MGVTFATTTAPDQRPLAYNDRRQWFCASSAQLLSNSGFRLISGHRRAPP